MLSDGAAYGVSIVVYLALAALFIGFSLLYPRIADKCCGRSDHYKTYGDEV